MTTASGQNQDFSRFQNLTKRVYAKKIIDLVPESDQLSKDIPFSTAEKVGDDYAVPVTLTREGGVTFNADGSVFQLRRGRAGATERATVRGNEMVYRTTMAYSVLTRAMTGTGSKEGDKRAFVNATKHQMANLVKSASYVRELSTLYGGGSSQATGGNLGILESVTDGTGTLTAVVTAASWATGIWVGSEGLEFDIYSGSTKRNSAGTEAAGDSVFKLTAVAPLTRTLTFTSHATNTAAAAISDTILFAGAYQKEQLGIMGVINTSGSVWGISNSTYNLWKPKTVTVGGQLTYEALQTGCAKCTESGFEGTLNVYLNPFTWQDIADDQAALVRHVESKGGKVKMGFNQVTLIAQTGEIVLKPYRYMKQGEAVGLPVGCCSRIGSTDLTFNMNGREMMRELEDYAGIEVRMYADQAFFSELPGAIVNWTGIVNSKNSAS